VGCPQDAAIAGQDVLDHPDGHELIDPHGDPVPADVVDASKSFTVEADHQA
jgi:hypothetical protein